MNKNATMLAACYEAAKRGEKVAILCPEGVVWIKLEAATKGCTDVDWLEEWREHNPPIDEEVPSQFFTGKGSDKPFSPFLIDTDYLLQIRDRNKDRVIRELAGKLHEIIRRVHEIEEDYLK